MLTLFLTCVGLVVALLAFLVCCIAPLYKNHEACRPEDEEDDDHE